FPITGSSAVAIHSSIARERLAFAAKRCRAPAGARRVALRRRDRVALLVHRLHCQRLLEILLDDVPVEVVEERIDVLGAGAAVIDPVRVLVHVERDDRVAFHSGNVFCASPITVVSVFQSWSYASHAQPRAASPDALKSPSHAS